MSPDQRRKFISALDLAQRAGTPGEREAAIYAVGQIVCNHNAWFHDLIAPGASLGLVPQHEPPERSDDILDRFADWRGAVEFCLDHETNDWEHEFLVSCLGFPYLSPKQLATVRAIVRRTLAAAA
jgi:hypothetical protein